MKKMGREAHFFCCMFSVRWMCIFSIFYKFSKVCKFLPVEKCILRPAYCQGVELRQTTPWSFLMALTLEQVEQAISDVLEKGQAVTVDGDTFTMASLPHLQSLRRELKSEQSGGVLSRAAFGRPRR